IGNLPDPRTRQNALRNGVKLEHHARQLIPDDLANYDYILVMDQSNMEDTLLLDPKETYRHKIFLLREFDSQNDNLNVPDPYFGGEDGFQQVFEIIDRSADGFLHFLNKPGT
ncbi:MAG: low molecular weight phosphotyrosine protein phosphatase, partial [Cyclobacteriaceae bacterium]|nr:low molecular weight phosphotyrosine protein phosphatase [Cyclobacteriaceae bacterium]